MLTIEQEILIRVQRVYADTFKIFCDPLGGDQYGAVWDPTLKQPRPFRVLGGFSSIPVPKVRTRHMLALLFIG